MTLRVSKTESKPHLGKVSTYNDVVSYLSALPENEYSQAAVDRMRRLDELLGSVSSTLDILLIAGVNGKSITANLTAKLLREEGFNVGVSLSSHILTFNERIAHQDVTVNNKEFVEVVSKVIEAIEFNGVEGVTSYEVMHLSSLLYLSERKCHAAILEVGVGGKYDATAAFTPKVTAITRVAEAHPELLGTDLDQMSFDMILAAKQGSWLIAAEQSKIRLRRMKEVAEKQGILWAMPVRKLAALPYMYEQLYGRIASLAERIAQIYVEEVKGKFSPFFRGNLLATEEGKRGRPSKAAKKNAELNPIKTLKDFWSEQFSLLRGRFELLDKEKPRVLLDNASNVDALFNLFLGIRLLHYDRSIKNFIIIMGIRADVDAGKAIKLMRYLLKKVPGTVFFVPLPEKQFSHSPAELEKIAAEFNVKSTAFSSVEKALEEAKAVADERQGLICITGSMSMISAYWQLRDVKKLS